MLLTLAAAAQDPSVFEVVTGIFSRVDTLAQPDNLMLHLKNLSVVWAAIFFAAGLVSLLQGYKFYKAVTVVMAFMIGGFVGYTLGKQVKADYIVAGCCAALFAVSCWPLMKYAVAAMGGLAGAFLGANAWSAVVATMNTRGQGANPDPHQNTYWVGALVGLVLCGMLAFILFKLSVVMFTCVCGATVAVLSGISLLMQVPHWQDSITGALSRNAVALPLLVFVPALIGLILQHHGPEKAGGGAGGGPKPAAKPA
ncbi:MAG: TMEM198/TM7SF3 family protein [Planctomycetes bacterium]|nr:TMEM198/TM7SF3 family protein [Planctomycetota bacterium]